MDAKVSTKTKTKTMPVQNLFRYIRFHTITISTSKRNVLKWFHIHYHNEDSPKSKSSDFAAKIQGKKFKEFKEFQPGNFMLASCFSCWQWNSSLIDHEFQTNSVGILVRKADGFSFCLIACPSGLCLWSKKHKFYFININHFERLIVF